LWTQRNAALRTATNNGGGSSLTCERKIDERALGSDHLSAVARSI
jgi:hypothetical protein